MKPPPNPSESATPFERELAEFFGEAPPGGVREPVRDHVTFRGADGAVSPLAAAEDLVRCLRAARLAKSHLSYDTRMNARADPAYSGQATARVAPYGGRVHAVRFASLPDGRLLASHKLAGGRELSALLHHWLGGSNRVADICWRTADEFRADAPGHASPV